jgi:hypothetical protein
LQVTEITENEISDKGANGNHTERSRKQKVLPNEKPSINIGHQPTAITHEMSQISPLKS